MLSTEIVTHRVIVKNQDGKGITKYPLTKEMYAEYSIAKVDRKPWSEIWLKDLDWENLRKLDPIKFEEFEEVKQDKGIQWAVFICSFWVRHPLSMGWICGCSKEFDVIWILFKDRLKEMWYDINYPEDITEEMRLEYKKKYL